MDVFPHLANGFAAALTPTNLFMAFVGSLLGTLVGVLPGLGPTAAIAILFPLTSVLTPAAAIIMLVRLTVFHSLEVGTTGLTGAKWIIGMVGLFGLGALMTLGIGLYAPCLILVTLLGMNDKSGYPIMMGACAFLMPVAVIQFIRARAYYPSAMLSMALPGWLTK